MKNFTDSDYALNKYSKGIVYKFGDSIVEVTLDDYLKENPHRTAADFQVLKQFSDDIYLEQSRQTNATTKKDVPLTALTDTEVATIESPEDYLIGLIDEAEQKLQHSQKAAIAKSVMDKLTETQRRRYLLHHVKGLTYREIGEIEGKDFKTIFESVEAAEKKIKKILKNG